MISTPQVIQSSVQEAAVIRLAIPRSEMMKVFGPTVGELMAAPSAFAVSRNSNLVGCRLRARRRPEIHHLLTGKDIAASAASARRPCAWVVG